MYAPYFGLTQAPFSIAPDPRYLFMSERHREALAHLLYGVGGGGGFVLLTGEIGAGKTTVCRCFLEQVPAHCNVAYIFNPKLTVVELLRSVCEEFGIAHDHAGAFSPTVKGYLDPLNRFLLEAHAAGRNNVLIIDEAQMLSPQVLEQLRLLTNLETSERKLLQIVLIGQPELRTMLARPELEQLAQRVIARFHLEALSEAETTQYIGHRLAVAGLSRPAPFDAAALRRIHRLAHGVPRRINLLCDRALLGAYASGRTDVDVRIVDKAAAEVFGGAAAPGSSPAARRRRVRLALAGSGLALAAAAGGFGVASLTTAGGLKPGASAASASAPGQAAAQAASTARGTAPPGSRLAAVATPAASAASVPAPASGAASGAPVLAAFDPASAFSSTPHRTESDAWRELALAWRLAPADGDPCGWAQRQQVHCFRASNLSLALIRQLDRPGIVSLQGPGAAGTAEPAPLFYALLTGLSGQSATLRMGGVVRTVSLAALARWWRGDFATFWRAPAGYAGGIVDGSSSALARTLAEQLATLQDAPAASEPTDATGAAAEPGQGATLRSRIAAFQLAQGLRPDGRAGPTTLMQLNRLTGVDEPRLLQTAP